MSLTQLLKSVGDENIRVQNLIENMTNIKFNERRQISTITFQTDQLTPNDIVLNEGNIGLIVWIPKDKLPDTMR